METEQKSQLPFLCGLHEVSSHIMVSPDLFIRLFIYYLFIYLFVYLFVYESRAPVTWSSVYGLRCLCLLVGCKLGFEQFFSGDRITS